LILFNYLSNELNNIGLNTRVDINLEDDASLNIINMSNKNLNNNFLNFRQKISIGKNSILKNYSLDINENSNFKYSFKDINLEKNSHLEYFVLSKGSKFSKHDISCSLNNEYGSVVLNGIIDLNDERHHEIKTKINHNEENCKSYQLIKSVLNDNSKGVYQGKIYVDSKAQKTDGYQLSRALLLSDEVEFNAKPELEIYADDVKCSHGSTSGNIDENSIFYLMSRGLSYEQSKKLLTNGFLNEVIEKITNEDVKSLVKKLTGINE
jgi:Fe-S cluster assembly protein SufD